VGWAQEDPVTVDAGAVVPCHASGDSTVLTRPSPTIVVVERTRGSCSSAYATAGVLLVAWTIVCTYVALVACAWAIHASTRAADVVATRSCATMVVVGEDGA
jgi:hypothetical protein